jgi:hypothetical protein
MPLAVTTYLTVRKPYELVQFGFVPLPVVQYTLVCIPQLHIWLMQGHLVHRSRLVP